MTVLEEKCPICGYPNIEEKREFKGEKIAVCVCVNPLCDYYNWEISKTWMDEGGEINSKMLDESKEWAEKQAEELKHQFLTKQPLKLNVIPATNHVKEYLDSKKLSYWTRQNYFTIISHFLEWFQKKMKAETEN